MRSGGYEAVEAEGGALVLHRSSGGDRLTIALNLTGAEARVGLGGDVLLSTSGGGRCAFDGVLGPDEGVILDPGAASG